MKSSYQLFLHLFGERVFEYQADLMMERHFVGSQQYYSAAGFENPGNQQIYQILLHEANPHFQGLRLPVQTLL